MNTTATRPKYADVTQMWQVKQANEQAGYYFFSPGANRFFSSRAGQLLYKGPGGMFFVTSEQFDHDSPRNFTVREFNPENGNVNTADANKFNEGTRYQAHKLAKELAAGE